MALDPIYQSALEDAQWEIPQDYEALFNWNYSDDKTRMLGLYQKGKDMQWDAESRIDWSIDVPEQNPMGLPHEMFQLYGADFYMKMPEDEQHVIRRHVQAWMMSQFLHGEQGALLCSAKIVTNVPDMESKFYASTQVMDEARHVETYKKFIEKMGIAYPITGPLKTLLDQVMRDSRWDMTYLGMQVVIEGLALAAFSNIRDNAKNELAAAVNAYVMQDEARHVAFGRLALKDYYPQLTDYERKEREEFLVEACFHMRDRFQGTDVWEALGLDVKACTDHVENSEGMKMFRTALFSRIVPVVKDIGLWGETIVKGYDQMGVLGFQHLDIDQVQENDMAVAADHDARRAHVDGAIAQGAAAE